MVNTRSQTKKLQQIQEQQIQEQLIQNQVKRREITATREQCNGDLVKMEIVFIKTLKDEIFKFNKSTDPYTRMSIMADMFAEIIEYLPTIISDMQDIKHPWVKTNHRWVQFIKDAYNKLYELYEDIYVLRKPKTIYQLCVMNKMIEILKVAQPIVRSLMPPNSILKDEIEFRLYDISELSI